MTFTIVCNEAGDEWTVICTIAKVDYTFGPFLTEQAALSKIAFLRRVLS